MWLGISPLANAQAPQDIAAAREHFKIARSLEEKKDWAAAVNELNAALTVKETPGLRYHLAYCQEQLANYAEALTNYERAQQLLTEGQKAADVSRLLGPALERVSALVAEVEILPPDAGPYKVFLDGNEVAANVTIRVDPGLHTVRALRNGQPEVHQFVATAQSQHKISLKPPPAPAPQIPGNAPPADPKDQASPREARASLKVPVLIGEAALTAVALGVGVGFTFRADQASSEADRALAEIGARAPEAQCASADPSVRAACTQLVDFKQREQSARSVATAGFVSAGAGAVLFVATWLLWPEETHDAAGSPRLVAGSDGRRSFLSLHGQF